MKVPYNSSLADDKFIKDKKIIINKSFLVLIVQNQVRNPNFDLTTIKLLQVNIRIWD